VNAGLSGPSNGFVHNICHSTSIPSIRFVVLLLLGADRLEGHEIGGLSASLLAISATSCSQLNDTTARSAPIFSMLLKEKAKGREELFPSNAWDNICNVPAPRLFLLLIPYVQQLKQRPGKMERT